MHRQLSPEYQALLKAGHLDATPKNNKRDSGRLLMYDGLCLR